MTSLEQKSDTTEKVVYFIKGSSYTVVTLVEAVTMSL